MNRHESDHSDENSPPGSDVPIAAKDAESRKKGPSTTESDAAGTRLPAWLERHRWAIFILPLLVFMLLGMLEPKAPPEPPGPSRIGANTDEVSPDDPAAATGSKNPWYPLFYSLRIALTVGAILLVLPGYREFPLRVSPLAILVGVAGVVVWVGVCRLHLEEKLFVPIGLGSILGLGQRVAFNPLEMFGDNVLQLAGFLAVRFFGLVVVVAVIEEFFLRGYVLRMIVAADWWKIPFGTTTVSVVVASVVYGVLTHPAELFAAALWFSLVTWLMAKTRNIWDCVVAHAVTNLLLGIYVLVWQDWALW